MISGKAWGLIARKPHLPWSYTNRRSKPRNLAANRRSKEPYSRANFIRWTQYTLFYLVIGVQFFFR